MSKVKAKKQELVKYKEYTNIDSVADVLITIGEKLKNDRSFILKENANETVVAPSNDIELEYELTKKGDKYEFEIELEWYDSKDKSKMTIE